MTWLLFTAGRGPGECEVAVVGLLRAMEREAKAADIAVTMLEEEGGPHGLLSALVSLDGEQVDAFAHSWEGSVLWICPSALRPSHRRKNWFVGVTRLAPPPPAQAMRTEDLVFEACRASGPGGQHVNKTNSAVRLTHRPSGVSVLAQEERSQHRNRALATARLWALLSEREAQTRQDAATERWRNHADLERGNPIRTYKGPDFVRA
ncbi:peptide chain release factor H [Lacibacterium aquatile]|uniref:Peptide chain release factor H n=1 Tax=Lacibacterium aquatile TaxID=1168082 RepID=A0ABW5DKD5_9PROT